MKRGRDDMEVIPEMDMNTLEDAAFKRVRMEESNSLVALGLDKLLNYLEVDFETREKSLALLNTVMDANQIIHQTENPIYLAGAVIWITKKSANQMSASFYFGRIFSVCEKVNIAEPSLCIQKCLSVFKTVVSFLDNNPSNLATNIHLIIPDLQKIESMHESLSKIHNIYKKSIELLFKPKSVVDAEKYHDLTNYLWILFCFARGIFT